MKLLRRGEDVTVKVNRRVAGQKARIDRQASILMDRAAGLAGRASELAGRVDSIPAEVARRVAPRPKPRRRLLFITVLVGLVGGFTAAYFGDREQGRARRAEVGRQLDSIRLEATRAAQRGVTVAADRASGVKSRVMGPENRDPDDLTLLDRVESEVFADPSIPKKKINLMVVDGKAVIRGQVEEPQIRAIEAAVRKVVGVREVENLLHPAGTPAPNKAASLAVGNGDSAPI
ncbi:MAG TPA: BON domain-containing protein [Candidatus Dormibacteraeota bacterium]|nr:BON domain-containing protein [Candidatus Dormibacteraeota bacterium]